MDKLKLEKDSSKKSEDLEEILLGEETSLIGLEAPVCKLFLRKLRLVWSVAGYPPPQFLGLADEDCN